MANNNGCSISSFERNKYFYSKLLTVRDFELEQQYGIEKNRLIDRLILGEGIVCGLEIQLDRQMEPDVLTVTLTPGVALDRGGREIVVSKAISKQLEIKSFGTQYIYIEYTERDKEPIADIANGLSGELSDRYNRVVETFSLSLSSEAPPDLEPKPDSTAETLEELVQEYAAHSLKTCSPNKYKRIPLAVITISDRQATLNESETQKIRPILRSNPLLYNLLERVYDLTQQAIDIPQIDANSFVSSDESINITPTEEPHGFDFTLASGISEPTNQKIFTGKRVLGLATDEDLPPGTLQPVPVQIDELAENEPFSVILAPQMSATVPPISTPPLEKDGTGLHFVFGSHPELPRSYVAYVPQPYNKTFEIHGCDRNLNELKLKQVEVVYWVIAGAKEPSLKDRILELLANNPEGIGIGLIGRELEVKRSTLQDELTQLINDELIRRNNGTNGKYFLV